MRRGRLVLALAAAATLTLAGCSSGDGGDDADADAGATSEATEETGGAEGTIKIGIKFDQPGLGYQDGSEYTGFDVDVAKFVAGELGYGEDQIEWVQAPSAQRIKDEYAAGTNLLEQPGYAECVTALTAGTVDAVTTDDIILAGLAAVPANEGKVKVVGNPFSEENYGVGIAKDSDKCEAINEAITKMIEDGTWEELLDKNVGASGYVANDKLNPPTPAACA